MIKFYEEVMDIINQVVPRNGDDFEITPGTFQVIQEYFNNLSEVDKFSLLEKNDNTEFVLSLSDEIEAEIALEEDEEFIKVLDKIDEEAVEDMHRAIEGMMTEEDYKEFNEWVKEFAREYLWEGSYNAS